MLRSLLQGSLILTLLAGGLLPLTASGSGEDDPVRVAAAANLRPVLPVLAAAYARVSVGRIEAVFASSGKLFAQIQAGAPFHLYLSANDTFPARLAESGRGLGDSAVYARGTLVCASAAADFPDRGSTRDLVSWLAAMRGKAAIANPALAPYGSAYDLFHRTFADALPRDLDPSRSSSTSRILMGENVSQAYQFLVSGAECGFVPLSQVLESGEELKWIEIGEQHTGVISQAGILLAGGNEDVQKEARGFWEFLLSEEGQTILQQAGYR